VVYYTFVRMLGGGRDPARHCLDRTTCAGDPTTRSYLGLPGGGSYALPFWRWSGAWRLGPPFVIRIPDDPPVCNSPIPRCPFVLLAPTSTLSLRPRSLVPEGFRRIEGWRSARPDRLGPVRWSFGKPTSRDDNGVSTLVHERRCRSCVMSVLAVVVLVQSPASVRFVRESAWRPVRGAVDGS
jgi:hypothetical protein